MDLPRYLIWGTFMLLSEFPKPQQYIPPPPPCKCGKTVRFDFHNQYVTPAGGKVYSVWENEKEILSLLEGAGIDLAF